MTREQQIELSRQELVNTLSAGIWFENILNQALLRDLMHADPTARATHYALTEMGDETRHMVMFGRAIEKVGGKPMRPQLLSAHAHQRPAADLPGLAALGGRAGRRGDLRLPAAQHDGRSGTATDRAAAHADSRHRGGTPHPVRPRRGAQARRPRCRGSAGCGWPTSTASAGCSSGTCSPTPRSTAESASTARRRAASPAAARTATTCRCSGSPRWPRSSTRSA